MPTTNKSNKFSEQINRLYPLKDKLQGIRYRVVDELGGTTELEAIGGQARYVATHTLQDQTRWHLQT